MNNESWRTEIKRANNSFKRMKQLSDILVDMDNAKNILRSEGYNGSMTEMVKKLMENKKDGKASRKNKNSL